VPGQPIDHGGEVEGRSPGPVRQSTAVELDAGAGQDLALSVERQVSRKLRHQQMRDGAFGRQPTSISRGAAEA